MPTFSFSLIILGSTPLLSSCVPRLYSPLELADVARHCELPVGDLVQEADYKRILILYPPGASRAQVDCAHKWARQHNFHFGYVESVEQQQPSGGNPP